MRAEHFINPIFSGGQKLFVQMDGKMGWAAPFRNTCLSSDRYSWAFFAPFPVFPNDDLGVVGLDGTRRGATV